MIILMKKNTLTESVQQKILEVTDENIS